MEYGYEITDTTGNKSFFVEGCTWCRMSTGGSHELGCPYSKEQRVREIWDESHRELGNASTTIEGNYELKR